jgi:tetratricopeptide (TPR) repeat protein
MKKLPIIAALFFSLTVNTWADKADSLKQVLRSVITDTARVNTLNELAELYLYSRPDTCLLLAQKGIALARQAGFEKGEAYGLNIMGGIFWVTGDYAKSLDYDLQSLKEFERLHYIEGIGRAYNSIGITYAEQGDFKNAIPYFRKCRATSLPADKSNLVIVALINLGDCYEKLNQLDSSRIYTNQAYELALRYRNKYPDYFGIALNNLGNIHSKMKQDKIALEYYHMSLPEFTKKEDLDGACETTMGMAQIFKKAGEQDSAFYYSRLSLAAGIKGGFTKRVLNASSFLSGYYRSLNRPDSAYHYQEITIAAKDSLFSQEKVKALQNLTFQEQVRQQEMAELNSKAEEERKTNIQMLGIGTFIPFFFGFLFIFSNRKTNQKAIRFLGLLGVLLLFEFISLFLHPYIALLTHHTPILMLLVLVGIASVLVPLHHRLEKLVKERLARNVLHAPAATGAER